MGDDPGSSTAARRRSGRRRVHWLGIGVGAGVVVVAAGVVVGVVLATQQAPAASNPGGTTVVLDASLLNKVLP
jgi:hypothetical protein